MAKKVARQDRMNGPLTVEIDPPKPKVLTKEELHQAIDRRLDWGKNCPSDLPVVICKWEYDSFVRGIESARSLREEVSGLKEVIEYYEGKRPLDEVHRECDRIEIKWRRMCNSGELVEGLRRAGRNADAEREAERQKLLRKNDDHLSDEFRTFLEKERTGAEQPST